MYGFVDIINLVHWLTAPRVPEGRQHLRGSISEGTVVLGAAGANGLRAGAGAALAS